MSSSRPERGDDTGVSPGDTSARRLPPFCTIEPDLGSTPGILAQDIPLIAPLNVQFATAFLTGSNQQVDFQNVGFTGEVSVLPEPSSGLLLGAGLLGLTLKRRCRERVVRAGIRRRVDHDVL